MSAPALEVRSFAVTIPASTVEASPYTASVAFPARVVVGVHWKVPPGPSGLMGWRLSMSGGNAVIPKVGWIITDDDADTWALTGQPDSGQWEVTGYNTDTLNDHTVYLDFLLDLVGQAPAAVTLTSNSVLSSPPGVAAAGVTAG